MQEYKQFKDPIYGYVKIPSDYVTNIIDSAEFQRLRRRRGYNFWWIQSIFSRSWQNRNKICLVFTKSKQDLVEEDSSFRVSNSN